MKSRVLFWGLVLAFLASGTLVFAGGAKEVPQIQTQTPSPWYLSPTGTSSTAKHTASVTFSVTMPMKSKTGYIPEYSVAIDNSSGQVVRNIVQKQQPDLGFFARLFAARKDFTLSKTIEWDGKDNSGAVVPDGTYAARLTVVAQDGTKQTTDIGNFIVDTQPPTVTISAPNGQYFNPKGTGPLSSFRIDQTNGTTEQLWTGQFLNASGQVVRTYTWQNSAPQSFSWDGRDSSGNLLPDGSYSYQISSTDQAGNQSQLYTINGIVLNTETTPVNLTLTNPYFSPVAGSPKPTTTIEMSTSAKTPVINWKLSISSPAGQVVQQWSGTGPFPSSELFDGKDSSGNLLPNGSYTVTFNTMFQNGNLGEQTAPVVLSVTPPPVAISFSNPDFSPTSGSLKPTTTATLALNSSEPVDHWSLTLTNSAGTVVRSVSQTGQPPSQLVFDGKDSNGNVLPNGTYSATYAVTVADGLSNSASAPLVIDTVPPKVTLSVSANPFMPNGSGSDNTETISYTSSKSVTWTGSLTDYQGRSLLQATSPQTISKVVLDKSNPVVAQAPAGLYTLSLTFEDNAGNTYSPPPVSIALFTHPINTTITVNGSGFSPSSTTGMSTITAALSTDTPGGIAKYSIGVVNQNGTVVADFPQQGTLQSNFTWNGTTGAGSSSYPPDGTYRMRLTIDYQNGLTSAATSKPFILDITPPSVTLAGSSSPFVISENGSSVSGSANATLTIAPQSGRTVGTWTASIIDPAGSIVKSYNGNGSVAQDLSWQGSLPLSPPVPTAITRENYSARVTATDEYGNQATVTFPVQLNVIGRMAAGKIHLLVPNLLFGPYKYALDSKSPEQGQLNMQTLSQVAELLKLYPSYNLEIDGYSMEIYQPTSRYYNEQENIIVPLTKNRADIARNALIQLGINPDRLFARYWGGMNTLVNPLNVDLRWQNRRDEFVLLPPGTQPASETPYLVQRLKTATGQ